MLEAAALGVVEGVTEFIPVSSTGHLIVFGKLLNFCGPTASFFEIFIQLGAILAVVLLFRQRFFALFSFNRGRGFSGIQGLKLLAITTLPALFFGALLHGWIKKFLFNPFTVSIGLVLGGLAILLVERLLKKEAKSGLELLHWKDALAIGLFQCLAMWPGVSRSAATILGGMLIGIDRKTSAEYSFLAAVPVIFAAVLYDFYKSLGWLTLSDAKIFAIGFVTAFVSAWLAVKFFIRLVSRHTLEPFGWYRIFIGPVIFWFMQ